jgi:hypothetical protein
MGHGLPNLIGVKPGNLDERMRKVVPGYMTMAEARMADMGEMGMPVPPNSIPMLGAKGKHDAITMGGMFTVLKVRDGIRNYKDPGCYETYRRRWRALRVNADLHRDGIDVEHPPAAEDGSTA